MFLCGDDRSGQVKPVAENDIGKLETYMKAVLNGDFSQAVPQVRDPRLQNFTGLLGQFMQQQEKTLIELSMEINATVYEETHASKLLNDLATEYELVMHGVKELLRVVDAMTETVSGLAGAAFGYLRADEAWQGSHATYGKECPKRSGGNHPCADQSGRHASAGRPAA